jgi:hypothetical protein
VRPFFAPLTALKKELNDELRKKDMEIPLSVCLPLKNLKDKQLSK